MASREGSFGQSAPSARVAVIVAMSLHLVAITGLVIAGTVTGPPAADPLRPIPIALLYLAPALFVVLALRGRRPLLLVAGSSCLVLAIWPFSLHSFALVPVGLVYAIAYVPLRGDTPPALRTLTAVVLCPPLLIGALAVLFSVSDVVVGWEAIASLLLTGAAVGTGAVLVPPTIRSGGGPHPDRSI